MLGEESRRLYMDNNRNDYEFRKPTSEIIKSTLNNIVEALTGIATSTRQEWFLSIGHILQRIRAGQFLEVLYKEWNKYKEKGRIKDDYQFTEQHHECLQELLEFLDKDIPDEIRFQILKRIFILAATEKFSTRDDLLPIQYMKIARKLDSGQVLVVMTGYKLLTHKIPPRFNTGKHSKKEYFKAVAENSGLKHTALVEIFQNELVDKNLMEELEYPLEGFIAYRLTDLGLSFCNFIEKYIDLED